jgi:hypothetical protein
MGIETLNSAAWAAGFAMAPPDEVQNECLPAAETDSQRWRPGEVALVAPTQNAAQEKAAHGVGEWFKGVIGVFGRRAPA